MKGLVISMSCIYLAAVLSAVSGGAIVKRSTGFCVGKADGLFPNPGDCTTFIQCSNEITHIMNCPASLHFNNATQQCDFPANANCNPLSDFCAGRDPGNYNHPTDCDKFVSCTAANEAVVMLCPLDINSNRLHYNQTVDQCQRPEDAGCN